MILNLGEATTLCVYYSVKVMKSITHTVVQLKK